MGKKKAEKALKKQLEKQQEEVKNTVLGITSTPNKESLEKLKKRQETFTLVSAKVRIARLLDDGHQCQEELEKLRDALDVKIASEVVKANDDVFEDVIKIRNLYTTVASEEKEERVQAVQTPVGFNLTANEMVVLNTALERSRLEAPEDRIQKEYEEEMKNYTRHVESFKSTLKEIQRVKDYFPSGTVKKMLIDAEILIEGLMNCYIKNEQVVEKKQSNRSKKKKPPPPTQTGHFILAGRLRSMINILGETQNYEFDFPVIDDKLTEYVPPTSELDIQGNIRLFHWITDPKNQKCFHARYEERETFQKLINLATRAHNKLEALSYLLAYLDPSYDKYRGPYREDHIIELILTDQFPKIHATNAQLEEIIKLKEKERQRRIRSGGDLVDAMFKPFDFFDIRVTKLRSSNRLAKFYFYLYGYISNEIVPLTRLFLASRDITLRMVEKVHDTCRQIDEAGGVTLPVRQTENGQGCSSWNQ